MSTGRRRELANMIADLPIFSQEQRVRRLRRAGVVAGPQCLIARGFRISGHNTLTMGRYCTINFGSYIDCEGPVEFDDFVGLAPNVTIITTQHGILDPTTPDQERITSGMWTEPVRIGHHTWIGTSAVILPGVTIGERCMIGAGAIVKDDCEPGGIYVGTPARRIRSIPGWEQN